MTHGRGGAERADRVPVEGVAERVVQDAPCPVFFIPVHSSWNDSSDWAGARPVRGNPDTAVSP